MKIIISFRITAPAAVARKMSLVIEDKTSASNGSATRFQPGNQEVYIYYEDNNFDRSNYCFVSVRNNIFTNK